LRISSGSAGTATASLAWQLARWPGVCVAGAAFALCGLLPVAFGPASVRVAQESSGE